jgi:hypothetical protein
MSAEKCRDVHRYIRDVGSHTRSVGLHPMVSISMRATRRDTPRLARWSDNSSSTSHNEGKGLPPRRQLCNNRPTSLQDEAPEPAGIFYEKSYQEYPPRRCRGNCGLRFHNSERRRYLQSDRTIRQFVPRSPGASGGAHQRPQMRERWLPTGRATLPIPDIDQLAWHAYTPGIGMPARHRCGKVRRPGCALSGDHPVYVASG